MFDVRDRCEKWGRFLRPYGPGVSWRQLWFHTSDGPSLGDAAVVLLERLGDSLADDVECIVPKGGARDG
jgi:hypothetical protein